MKKNKGLGRGIDALFQDLENLETVDVTDETVIQLPLNELRPNPYQPRKTFEEVSLQELANSIEQSGVFQPIIVRRSSVKGYEIIAGERRFRASKLAKKETIPAIVRDFDEEAMMQVAVLENLQREDLNPLEEAEAYDMLMKNLKLTQAEVANRLGKSRPYIANYLRLLTLPDLVKEMVQDQRLSMGQARTLLGLKNKSLILKLANRAVTENLTVRQLEQIVSQLNENDGKEKKKIPDDFSLVGIDDVSFARLFDPEITTLAQPIEKIALKAASLLWEQILGISQETTSDSYLYKPTLIQRSSVKKLN